MCTGHIHAILQKRPGEENSCFYAHSPTCLLCIVQCHFVVQTKIPQLMRLSHQLPLILISQPTESGRMRASFFSHHVALIGRWKSYQTCCLGIFMIIHLFLPRAYQRSRSEARPKYDFESSLEWEYTLLRILITLTYVHKCTLSLVAMTPPDNGAACLLYGCDLSRATEVSEGANVGFQQDCFVIL